MAILEAQEDARWPVLAAAAWGQGGGKAVGCGRGRGSGSGESGKNLLLLWEERETDPGRKLDSHYNKHPRNYLESVKISDQKPCVLALLVPQKRGLLWDPRVCDLLRECSQEKV